MSFATPRQDPVGIGERTTSGYEIRLRPEGFGRVFGAAFLAVWLTGWAVGESVVLFVLVRGAVALATGRPIGPTHSPMSLAAALAIGAFLLVWVALWTVGGVLAIRQLLSLVWAEDRLLAAGDLVVERRLGPFHSRRTVRRDDLRAIRVLTHGGALIAETAKGRVELTRLGGTAAREHAAQMLRRELGLTDAAPGDAGPVELPASWEEIVTPEGMPALVPNRATRRGQARWTGFLALTAGAATWYVVREAFTRFDLFVAVAFFGAATLAFAWWTAWLALGRAEWRIGSARLVLQKRFRHRVKEEFEATSLELSVSRDSDGDEWFLLDARAAGVVESRPSAFGGGPLRPKGRRALLRTMNDDTDPRRLGAWLSRRAGIPFVDGTTEEARRRDVQTIRIQLDASTTLGRLATRLIERLERNRSAKE